MSIDIICEKAVGRVCENKILYENERKSLLIDIYSYIQHQPDREEDVKSSKVVNISREGKNYLEYFFFFFFGKIYRTEKIIFVVKIPLNLCIFISFGY